MRTLLITVALLAFGSVASACDVCGCAIGGTLALATLGMDVYAGIFYLDVPC
ncbi:MAG: hypothetical protein ACKVT2_22795 [Saprospiraceae bacterium]